MGGEWALGVALVMEVWDAKYRPLLAGMIGAAANVGFLIVGAIGRAIQIDESNWRYLVLVGAAPALLTFIIRLFVPESHAWKAAQTAKPTKPLTELFGDKKLTRSAILAIVFASITLLGTWGAVQKIPSWVGNKDMSGNIATAQGSTQMALAIGAIVGCLLAPLVAAWLNRRITFFLLCLGSLITCQFIFAMDSYSGTFLAMAFLVGGFTAAVYGWLPLYLPELFPTRVRATAQGISFNFGRIFAGIGGIALGGSIPGGYARMGAVVSLIYVLGLVLIWLAPETKGKPLPEWRLARAAAAAAEQCGRGEARETASGRLGHGAEGRCRGSERDVHRKRRASELDRVVDHPVIRHVDDPIEVEVAVHVPVRA